MPVWQSITVSADPDDITISGETPNGASRPAYILSSLDLPTFAYRLTFAPDVDDVSGKELQAFALDAGSCAVVVKVHGSTVADLQTNRRALEALFGQQSYTFTVTLDGEDEVYQGFPVFPVWDIDVVGKIATATLSVPLNPMGA